jgi:hypothetical protein
MNTIETNLARAQSKFKWLRFLEYCGIAGSVVTLLQLLLGIAIDRLWITSSIAAYFLEGILVFGAFSTVIVVALVSLTRMVERRWLAQKLEEGQPQLEDRLNTLVHLEGSRSASSSIIYWIRRRITGQAETVLKKKQPSISFPWTRALLYNGVFILILMGTMQFYESRDPWQTLRSYANTRPAQSVEKPLDLALPDGNALEEKGDWGEMRITDPGKDLKITKVDTVQLQIEAAANRRLTNSTWFSTVNGLEDQPHALPPPTDPKYAAYQPIIYADEFNLKDWDVMTYYAQARTDHGNVYGSEVYFLEVRPFREDILKMAGGEGGAAYQTLGRITDLISRQQHVIRQTHHYVQTPPQTEKLQEQDRGKLADAENDLSEAAGHLYAEIAVKMENKPIGAALDQLKLAENTLLEAVDSLRHDTMTPAREQERLALRQLIDTRKLFQKAVSEHPDDFKDKPEDEERSPIAQDSKDKLNEMAEFRNEEKATRDFVDQLIKKQQTLAEEAAKASSRFQTNLVTRQRDLKTDLDQFSAQHPQMFKNATNELAQASDAMEKSATSLTGRRNIARKEPQEAADKTQKLGNALGAETVGRQLTSAYGLKKLLDQQIKHLEQVAQKPAEISQEDLGKASGQTKETLRQLKQIAEQKPTGDMFGPGLGSALRDENKKALDDELEQLGQSKEAEARRQLASKTGQDLRVVSKAFEQSQPKILQQAKDHDPLKEANSLEKGMEQLQSLLRGMQGGHPLSAEDLQKLSREARLNVRDGMRENYGSNEASQKLLLMLEEEFKEDGHKIDLAGLKKLMAELENFSSEVKDPTLKTNETAVTSVDASKLPPAYRGRIEKYFRKLSEAK